MGNPVTDNLIAIGPLPELKGHLSLAEEKGCEAAHFLIYASEMQLIINWIFFQIWIVTVMSSNGVIGGEGEFLIFLILIFPEKCTIKLHIN